MDGKALTRLSHELVHQPLKIEDFERYHIENKAGESSTFPMGVDQKYLQVQAVYQNMINQATDYVYIDHLIIDYDLTKRNAALRGVDVRIVTPTYSR